LISQTNKACNIAIPYSSLTEYLHKQNHDRDDDTRPCCWLHRSITVISTKVLCSYTCRATLFYTLVKLLQLPTSRDDEQESLTDAAHTYTTQQEKKENDGHHSPCRRKRGRTKPSPPRTGCSSRRRPYHLQPRNQGKRPGDRPSADESTSSGSLTSSRHRQRDCHVASNHRASSTFAASSGKTKSRDYLVWQRHEPRSLLKNHTHKTEIKKPSAKATREINFGSICQFAHVLGVNDVLKITSCWENKQSK
jgi:hypothetical protein